MIKLITKVKRKILREINPLRYAREIGVDFGNDCKFIKPNFGTEPWLIKMGDHVEVTNGVNFITHDGAVWVFRKDNPLLELFAPINIGSNVFIGINATILPGVTIGDNCIIGSGAVVTKDIPADSIAVGVPARVIKTIDSYYKSIEDEVTFIRDLAPKDKQAVLKKRFGI